MQLRRLCLSILLAVCTLSAFASDPTQVVTWPANGTPVLRFTFNKFKEVSAFTGQKAYVVDVMADNLSSKLIVSQKFSVYILDKKQVRIGEAWMQIDNVAPTQSVKFQISFNASGTPATVSVLDYQDIPRKISMTVNSVPQGANVKVDGVEAGVTPRLISVGVGKHQLQFSKEGYNTGTFPLEIGPSDVSGGSVSYELGASGYDTIVLRDGSVLNGDLDSIIGMDVVVRIGGNLQHYSRNQIKQIVMVQRTPPDSTPVSEATPKP